jgi:hypothetical protein
MVDGSAVSAKAFDAACHFVCKQVHLLETIPFSYHPNVHFISPESVQVFAR